MRVQIPTDDTLRYWSGCDRARGYSAPEDAGVDPMRLGAGGNAAACFLAAGDAPAHFIVDKLLCQAQVESDEDEPDCEWVIVKVVGPAPEYTPDMVTAEAHENPWIEVPDMAPALAM